jgi:hypothetical protein
MNPLTMNWAESLLQKLIYFLIVAVLVVTDTILFPIFGDDTKGDVLNWFVQFFALYLITMWFSKGFVSIGRRVQ